MRATHHGLAGGWCVLLLAGMVTAPGCDRRGPEPAEPGDEIPSSAPSGTDEGTVVFGAVADVQYCDCRPKRTRFYRESVNKLREAMEEIRKVGPQFVVSVGDIIDRDSESYATILPEFRAAGIADRYFVLGNHEWNVEEEDKQRVLTMLGVASGRYCFGIDGWRFIVLDGTEISTYANEEGSEAHVVAGMLLEDLEDMGAESAWSYNGAVSPEQLLWLDDELAAAQAAGERVIVFNHFPVYPPETSASLWNDGDIRWVLERYPGVAVAHISGHDHRGGYAEHGRVHYLTLHGMVETEESNAFAVFRLHVDRIEVEGYGRQPSYTLRLP